MNEKFFDLKKEKQDRMINGALKVFALNGYKHARSSPRQRSVRGFSSIISAAKSACMSFCLTMRRISRSSSCSPASKPVRPIISGFSGRLHLPRPRCRSSIHISQCSSTAYSARPLRRHSVPSRIRAVWYRTAIGICSRMRITARSAAAAQIQRMPKCCPV